MFYSKSDYWLHRLLHYIRISIIEFNVVVESGYKEPSKPKDTVSEWEMPKHDDEQMELEMDIANRLLLCDSYILNESKLVSRYM